MISCLEHPVLYVICDFKGLCHAGHFFDNFKQVVIWDTIRASTFSKFFNPCCACLFLTGPSKRKGLVTTPMVSAPMSFAIRAMTGDAPVPVHHPYCCYKNHVCAFRATSRSSLLSFADCSPTLGMAPPLVLWLF